MPDETNNTPTPWRAVHWAGGSEVFGAGGEPVVRTSAGYRPAKEQARIEENVELIVRAVNAHADLLAACEAFVSAWDGAKWGFDGLTVASEELIQQATEAARTAIAKAKGGAA